MMITRTFNSSLAALTRSKLITPTTMATALLLLAALILAMEPVRWLVNTWREPAYDSKGFHIFAAVAALFFWSVLSRRERGLNPHVKLALALLGFTALLRLAGQVLAVNTIGALALVIDVYALGLMAGLATRKRPLSPGWLAFAFAFSLPLERIAQRTIGYGLQNISADGACLMLNGLYDDVACHGVRIALAGKDVLVDLPCSGARTVLLMGLAFALAAALVRPSLRQTLIGGAMVLTAALIANMTRITVLAIGIAHPATLFDVDVMAQPWHELVGLLTLALGAAPLLLWTRWVNDRRPRPSIDMRCRHFIPDRISHDGWWLETRDTQVKRRRSPLVFAGSFLVLALVIVNLPKTPVDVARRSLTIDLPLFLASANAAPLPLLPKEKAYFVKYGGAAKKAVYGPHQLLVVRTSAPLRHLHAPDECLRGLGMKVRYLGRRFTPVPSAVYRAETADKQAFLITVSFVSDKGHVTSNVSQAVWHWLQDPGTTWSAIQRITPEQLTASDHKNFERAVIAALELPRSKPLSN